MNQYITKKSAVDALLRKGQESKRYGLGETWELNLFEIQEAIEAIPPVSVSENHSTVVQTTTNSKSSMVQMPICLRCGRGPILDTYVCCPYCMAIIDRRI